MSSSIQEFIPRFFWICSSFKVLVFCAMFHLDRVSALILFFIWRDFKILYFVWIFYISFSKVFPFTPASPVLLEICGQVSFAVFNVFMFSYLLFIISVVLNLLCCCLVILILFTCALCPQLCLVFLITSRLFKPPVFLMSLSLSLPLCLHILPSVGLLCCWSHVKSFFTLKICLPFVFPSNPA